MLPVLLICLPLLFAAPAVPKEPAGWSKARWGMTEQQILDAFAGEATVLDGPTPERTFNGVLVTVGIKSLSIGGTAYRVFFLMDPKTKTLHEVNLYPLSKADVTLEEFHAMEA